MHSQGNVRPSRLPAASRSFFEVFLPYEIILAQRRAARWTSIPEDELPQLFWGLFLARLEPAGGETSAQGAADGEPFGEHVEELLRSALRDSDIVGRIDEHEHLAVVRDLEYQQAYVAAQRFLVAASRSEVLRTAGLNTRLGYLIYPLSNQANLPPEQWSTLIDLARRLSAWGEATRPASGFGLSRGPETAAVGITETDLLTLFAQDAESMFASGILHLQRVELL